jgi:Tfp pilus assembly protein PilF
MSLLIKALKQAEKRHQEATAKAIEQVSSDPTMQAVAQAAKEASFAQACPSVGSTAAQPMAPNRQEQKTLAVGFGELSLSIEEPVQQTTKEQTTPAVVVDGALAAMSLTLSVDPVAPAQAAAAGAMAFAVSSSDPSPINPPAELPASVLASAPVQAVVPSDISAVVQKATAVENPAAKAPKAQDQIKSAAVAGAKLSGMALPKWMLGRAFRMGLVGCVAVMGSGGWLAWQIWGSSLGSTLVQTPPAPLPAPPQATSLEADKPRAQAANAADTNKSGPKPTVRSDSGPGIRGTIAQRPLESSKLLSEVAAITPKVGPSVALVSPEQATPQTAKKLSSSSSEVLEGRVEPAAPKSTAPNSQPSSAASNMRITRNDQQDQVARLLEQAYASMQRQDKRSAKALYDQVLSLDRHNADAVIGLAALAAKEGELATAERLYNRALEIDPNDTAARAGLAGLRSSADPAGQESQLRHLLASDPAQPSVQFALGNSLATQGRWHEAQQAYFNAFNADPKHPDYAFNLAISLERVRQPQLAAQFYRTALQLAQQRSTKFVLATAQQRLAAIEKLLGASAAGTVTLASGEQAPAKE